MGRRTDWLRYLREQELAGGNVPSLSVNSAALLPATVGTAILDANYTASGTGFTTVTDSLANPWQLIIPAHSGELEIYVLGGIAVSWVTGAIASSTQQTITARLIDDLGTEIGRTVLKDYGTGTSQTRQPENGILAGSYDDQASNRTVRVEFSHNQNGNSGASSQIVAGGIFPNKRLRARRV